MDDGWPYAGMKNSNIDLALTVDCPVCPVRAGTDGTEPKIRPVSSLIGRPFFN